MVGDGGDSGEGFKKMKTGAQKENEPHRTRTSAGAECGRTAGPPGSVPVC